MNINEIFTGKYLGAVDLDGDTDVTIIGMIEVEVTNEGKKETKYALNFREVEKPMILNKTNAKSIAEVLHSSDTDDWIGKRITLWVTSVESFGKTTEAIRVKLRAPKQTQVPRGNSAPARPQPTSVPDDPFGDDAFPPI